MTKLGLKKIKHGTTEIDFAGRQEKGVSPEYTAQLRDVGKSPPDTQEEIVEDLKSMILTNKEYASLPDTDAKIDYLSKKFATATLTFVLERLSSVIYGSQIRILEHLNSCHSSTAEEIIVFYNTVSEQYPTPYANYSFEQYMGFLENSLLVKKEDNKYSITGLGRSFLLYRVNTNRTGYYPPL